MPAPRTAAPLDGDSTISFVEGTPSSRASASQHSAVVKRNRQRSVSPQQIDKYEGLVPVPILGHLEKTSEAHLPHQNTGPSVPAPYVFRQYIAVQASSGNWQDRISESVVLEAEYLLDEASQLARSELGNVVNPVERVQEYGPKQLPPPPWWNMAMPQLTMDDIRIDGKSWTYQPPPPTIRASSPSIDIPFGAITGIPLGDLPEWEKVHAEEAFSPIRPLSHQILSAQELTGRKDERDLQGLDLRVHHDLGSPFDSQPRAKRKANGSLSTKQGRFSHTKKKPSVQPYVFVNDLPAWEWYYDAETGQQSLAAESAGLGQSQNVRESLRYSCDEERPRAQTGGGSLPHSRSNTTTMTGHAEKPVHVTDTNPIMEMASFITDVPITPLPKDPSTVGHPATAYELDGRILRRMPVVLPLDHKKMKAADHKDGETERGAAVPVVANVTKAVAGPKNRSKLESEKVANRRLVQIQSEKMKAVSHKDREIERGATAVTRVADGVAGPESLGKAESEKASNKRVMQLKGGQQQQQVQPIQSYLPLLGSTRLNGSKNPTQAWDGTGNDSIADISVVESANDGHPGTIEVRKTSPVSGPSTILVQREQALMGSLTRPVRSALPVSSEEEIVRRRIVADRERYGRLYVIIEEPHNLGASLDSPTDLRVPHADLVEPVPRLPMLNHPFHPFLEYYISKRPQTRVRWLIPVHGPVTVPGLAEQEPGVDAFRPSHGFLALDHEEFRTIWQQYRQQRSAGPVPDIAFSSTSVGRREARPLVWTAELLQEFWNKLIRLRRLGRFGPIGLALSSFEPGPFLPPKLNHPTHLERHRCIPSGAVGDAAVVHMRPTKPEVGDHIKVSCDLQFAMSVRFLLKGLILGGDGDSVTRQTLAAQVIQAAHGPPAPRTDRTRLAPTHSSAATRSSGSTSRSHMPFRDVKLCLVGDRGEVLAVV